MTDFSFNSQGATENYGTGAITFGGTPINIGGGDGGIVTTIITNITVFDVTTTYWSTPEIVSGAGRDATINGAPTSSTTLIGGSGDDVIDGTVIAPDTSSSLITKIETHMTGDQISPTFAHIDKITNTSTTIGDAVITPGAELAVDQTFIESAGANRLTGGLGADTFQFNVNLHELRHDFSASYDDIRATPTQLSGANANGVWNSYLDHLAEWRGNLFSLHGADDDAATTTTKYSFSSGKTVKSGVAIYDDSYAWHTTEWVTNVSSNTITDFGNGGPEKIALDLTAEQFAQFAHFTASDTVTIGAFSITTTGHTLTMDDFTLAASS